MLRAGTLTGNCVADGSTASQTAFEFDLPASVNTFYALLAHASAIRIYAGTGSNPVSGTLGLHKVSVE